jgi:hypothetical protein
VTATSKRAGGFSGKITHAVGALDVTLPREDRIGWAAWFALTSVYLATSQQRKALKAMIRAELDSRRTT